MPAPRWKNINVFPWRQESGKEGQLCTVRFSLSSLSTLPRPRKISRSSLSYSPPEVECKAIRPAYWTLARVREIRFSRIFVSDKTMAAIDSVEKGAAFSSRSKIEEETGGRMHACAPPRFLPSNGRGRTKGDEGRVFEPTCRGFSPNAASFVFPSFLFKALLNLSHGLSTIVHPGIDLLCRLHLNKGWNAQWNESSTFVSCFPSYFSFFLFQILIVLFLINKINNIIVQFTWKSSLNYIFKRGNVSIKTAWALTLSIIERHRKRYSLEMWYDVYIYIYGATARTETRKRLRHIRNKRRRILI